MLSRLLKNPREKAHLLIKILPNTQSAKYNFSSNSQESPSKKEDAAKTFSGHLHSTADFSKYANSFFNYLRGEQNPNEKTYSSLKIFSSRINLKYISASVQAQLYYTLFFSGIGYLVYNYVHVYLTAVPLWLASGSFVGFFMANSYAKKMVHQIELVDTSGEYVKLHVARGRHKEIICKIEDIELLDVFSLQPKKMPVATENSEEQEQSSESNKKAIGKGNFVANFHVDDINGKKFSNLRMIIDDKVCDIENVELLKHILLGDADEVKKFRFDDSFREKVLKEDQEYEKQIEEEFHRIKREKEEKNSSEKTEGKNS
jgi:hypothetical protein